MERSSSHECKGALGSGLTYAIPSFPSLRLYTLDLGQIIPEQPINDCLLRKKLTL